MTLRSRPRAAEFFAGIGLVRLALERAGIDVVWANDIEPIKQHVYVENFGESDYLLGDVRNVQGEALPRVDLATASFPCVDLSLAGWRRGFAGEQSGMFWEFARVIAEMGNDAPAAVFLENVPAFISSHRGQDLESALKTLNDLGYWCDLLLIDARSFVAQSRPRVFIIGTKVQLASEQLRADDPLRPRQVADFVHSRPHLKYQFFALPRPERQPSVLANHVDRVPRGSGTWWSDERVAAFSSSLSNLNRARLEEMRRARRLQWRTAYRRTRHGSAVWEIRPDDVAGCLRTARGGSSKQAIVEAGRGTVRIRWMTVNEYAALQGADTLGFSSVTPTQAMFGLGDAVCVPVVEWIARSYLRPALEGPLSKNGLSSNVG